MKFFWAGSRHTSLLFHTLILGGLSYFPVLADDPFCEVFQALFSQLKPSLEPLRPTDHLKPRTDISNPSSHSAPHPPSTHTPGTACLPHRISGFFFLNLPITYPLPPSQLRPPLYPGYFNSLSNWCGLRHPPALPALSPCPGCSFSPFPPASSSLSFRGPNTPSRPHRARVRC